MVSRLASEVQVGVDLLRIYNTILTLTTLNAPVRCGQLGFDVSRHQRRYEAVQVLSVDLRFDTSVRHSASDSDDRRSVEGSSPRQSSCPESKELFEI
ncbi:hypothetical protein QUA44_10665 [Microcoleus sp. N9_A2]|uniref:hypothetical protein n=1 Tax=unclassified Microcoleus TaxID=2642155 RepID=UPI002FD5D365